jgi:hypothetical protein
LFRVPGLVRNPVARIHIFFSLCDAVKSYTLAWNREIFSDRISASLLAIATTEGPDKVCLSIDGTDRGKVFYWDSPSGCTFRLADNFDQFFGSLYADDSSPLE